MSDKTMGEAAREAYHLAMNVDLSELDEWWECVKDGDAHAWQAAADAIAAPLLARIAELEERLSIHYEVHHAEAYQRGVAEERERCAKVVEDEAARILSKQTPTDDAMSLDAAINAQLRMMACVLPELAKAIRSASPAVDVTSDKGGER